MSTPPDGPERARQFRLLYRELRIADQQGYYERRRREYRQAHRQAVIVRNLLLLGAAISGPIGQLGAADVRAGSAIVAAVFAGLAAALTGFEALIDFVRLEKLYGDTAQNLTRALVDWDRPGAQDDPAAEVAKVEGILQAENGQWGQLATESAANDPQPGQAAPG